MDDRDFIGTRPTELGEADRGRLDALLRDPRNQDEHESALKLGARLAALPSRRGPSLDAVHRRARANRQRRYVTMAAAVAVPLAALLLWAVHPMAGTQYRGMAPAGGVRLEAAAEGPMGTRALHDGDVVHHDERVVFRVQSDRAGAASLLAVSSSGETPVWPSTGDWNVAPGPSSPGGDKLLSYRPDVPNQGAVEYRARVCEPQAGPCATDHLTLTWEP